MRKTYTSSEIRLTDIEMYVLEPAPSDWQEGTLRNVLTEKRGDFYNCPRLFCHTHALKGTISRLV